MAVWFGSYCGNKFKEVKNFAEFIPENIGELEVYEPFGGAIGLSRKLYVDGKITHTHFRDIDPVLLKIYAILSAEPDSNGISQTLKEFNDAVNICSGEFEKNEKGQIYDGKKIILTTICESMGWDSIFCKYLEKNMMFRGLIKITKIESLINTCKFMRASDWKKQDYMDTLAEVKEMPNAFVFLDPPYFDSDNSYYNITMKNTKKDDEGFLLDRTKLFVDIVEFMKDPATKCKVMLIINSNAITRYIYESFIKKEYDVVYRGSNKKTKHFVCANY